ncbi:MAG: hypothetical protein DKT66_18165 [Candidatus Melainabacteria bacterium]|nr:MAG: hypothetical protein DKT66_18165 [Candidatus Melainabacteria bacterium]
MTIQAFFEQGKVDAGKPSVNFLLAPLAVQRVEDRLITQDRGIRLNSRMTARDVARQSSKPLLVHQQPEYLFGQI